LVSQRWVLEAVEDVVYLRGHDRPRCPRGRRTADPPEWVVLAQWPEGQNPSSRGRDRPSRGPGESLLRRWRRPEFFTGRAWCLAGAAWSSALVHAMTWT